MIISMFEGEICSVAVRGLGIDATYLNGHCPAFLLSIVDVESRRSNMAFRIVATILELFV